MTKLLLLSITVCFTAISFAQNINPNQNKIFRYNEVMLVELAMSEAEKADLFADAASDPDHYYSARVHIKNSKIDTILAQVGIRPRGNTSRGSGKQSYKINFKAFRGEKFYNTKKFNLKAENNDPSMLREYLSLYTYRNFGVPAARASYAQVYINGEYMGLYLNVEQIDDEFVDRRYDDNEMGNLYKCLLGTSLESPNESYVLVNNEDVNDRTRLNHFISVLNNPSAPDFKEQLEACFNTDGYLRQLAVETLIGHWDGYSRNLNNYYLYEDTVSMQVQFIPYDMDNTWGIDWGFVDFNTEKISEWVDNSWYSIPLTSNLINDSDYKVAYYTYMATFTANLFNKEFIHPVVDSVHKLVAPFVYDDNYYHYTYGDFQNSLDEAYGYHVEHSVKDYLALRNTIAYDELKSYTSDDTISPVDEIKNLILTKPGDGFLGLNLSANNKSITPSQIQIYPNPVRGNYFVVSTTAMVSGKDIQAYDITGKQLKIEITEIKAGTFRIEFRNKPAFGYYVLKVGNSAQKLLVQ